MNALGVHHCIAHCTDRTNTVHMCRCKLAVRMTGPYESDCVLANGIVHVQLGLLNATCAWCCRSDAAVPSNEQTGVQACNVPQGASYTVSSTKPLLLIHRMGIALWCAQACLHLPCSGTLCMITTSLLRLTTWSPPQVGDEGSTTDVVDQAFCGASFLLPQLGQMLMPAWTRPSPINCTHVYLELDPS